MGDPIDPDKLRSLADIAKELGYHPSYLNKLAADGRIKSWRIGKAWATTAEIVRVYLQSSPAPGRPKASAPKKTAKKRSKKA